MRIERRLVDYSRGHPEALREEAMVQQKTPPSPDELASVLDLAEAHSMGESTAWLLIKRHDLPRFRLPGRGKTTLVRRDDFERALQTPISIGGNAKKAAA